MDASFGQNTCELKDAGCSALAHGTLSKALHSLGFWPQPIQSEDVAMSLETFSNKLSKITFEAYPSSNPYSPYAHYGKYNSHSNCNPGEELKNEVAGMLTQDALTGP